jgi:hypothetical protein
MARRNSSSITNLFSDIIDDIKDFVDDEIFDRAKDTEKDLRKAARNWTESDDDDDAPRRSRRGDVDDLHEAVAALTKKVDALAKK